jgi:hypothetical protein
MNVFGIVITMICVGLVLTGPPRRALIGMLAGVLCLTQVQQIELAGVNLFAFRLVELACFVRVISRKEFSFDGLLKIDRVFLAFLLFTITVYLLRTREGLANRIGVSVDAFLCYFAFRGLIKSPGDFRWFLRAAVCFLAPYSLLVLHESVTRNNAFAFVGGRVGGADMMRGDRLRALGSFRHPSLLGTLGASFLPLYIGLAFAREKRLYAIVGIGACLGIVIASNSGGPLSCALVAVSGWLLWKLRHHMNWFRRGLAGFLILMALVMKAPIWYLLAKVSSITGGGGFHRSRLMDRAFNDLGHWWLAGMPLENTIDWFPYYIHGNDAADITNQYVAYGLTAGLGAIVLFVLLLVASYRNLGMAMWKARAQSGHSSGEEQLLWGLGVALAVHIFNWFGITYFDQTYALWYLQLAALVGVSSAVLAGAGQPAAVPVGGDQAFPWAVPPAADAGSNGNAPVTPVMYPPRPGQNP